MTEVHTRGRGKRLEIFIEVFHGITLAPKTDHVMQIIFSEFSRHTSERLMKSALASTDD